MEPTVATGSFAYESLELIEVMKQFGLCYLEIVSIHLLHCDESPWIYFLALTIPGFFQTNVNKSPKARFF